MFVCWMGVFARAVTPAPPSAAAIDAAVQKGVDFLYSLQQPDGTWETDPAPPPGPLKKAPDDKKQTWDNNQYGAKTALAVFALLEAGQSPAEPRLTKPIAILRTSPAVSTYVLSIRCQVWASLPFTSEVKVALRRDATALHNLKKVNAQKLLVWDYAVFDPLRKDYQLASVQAAAWGLAAAGQADFEVPIDTWRQIERTFEAGQQPDGGWGSYIPAKGKPITTTTYYTAAAVASIYLAQDYSRADAYAAPHGNVANAAIDKGLKWIADHLQQPVTDPKAPGYEEFNQRQYGIGIAALASGLRRIGETDWYANGATDLLKRQNGKTGGWGGVGTSGDFRVTDTAWAVLFLQRGRVPTAFSKLNYAADSSNASKAYWNQRPRDVANVAAWIGRATERELRWQIVDSGDSVAAFLEAPVLFVAGGDTLTFGPELKAKLKAYVESGGLIFAAADAGSAAFAKSVEKLGMELFPGNEWRDVPDTHPLLATQMFRRPNFKAKPQVRAVGNGVREFILLVPAGDPAKTWQQRSGRVNPDAWQLAADVLSYAVDKSHFYARGNTWLVAPTTVVPKRTVTVGRLKYAGPWDPEPMAWTQFARYAQARDLGVKTVTVDAGQELKDVDVLYVTGSAAFTLDDAARAAIKRYLDGGGRVIFEAAGGNSAFAGSAQAELTRWYGADAVVPLPPTHALYGDKPAVAFRGYNIGAIDKPTEPQLRAVEVGGRVVALLSREDLTAGLLGVPTDGITGYTPESARSLLLRVLSRWK